ncbi:helix-turn-helix transcriptional regulator [Lentzea sp. NPDC042327]|uniref:helix-turn-helix domain-containing protein n=1 Tax=Lentzea sp. NPDC042327 TaxID=3154801 RepID=UPI0033EF4497
MTAIYSTAYSRDLGDELRLIRESSTSMHGRAMAARLGWDPSKVSNIEHGKAHASEIDIVQFLSTCGKDIDFIEAFRQRYRHAFDPYLAQMPENLRTLAMTESLATKITSYEPMMPPGLFQTRRYAQALLEEGGIEEPEDVRRYLEARMERQSLLRRHDRPECVFYVHELALQVRLGDDQLMEDQYLHLMFNTHLVRLVPAHVRAAAPQSKCTLYEFDKAPPIVFSETDMAQVFAQEAGAVQRARRLFRRLEAVALDAEQSKTRLAEYVSGLREDSDAPGTELA